MPTLPKLQAAPVRPRPCRAAGAARRRGRRRWPTSRTRSTRPSSSPTTTARGRRRSRPGTTRASPRTATAVAYLHEGPKNAQELKLAPATGGAARTLMTDLREAFYLDLLARLEDDRGAARARTRQAQAGPDRRRQRRRSASSPPGFFSGFSFSPDGDELVYARAPKRKLPAAQRRLPRSPPSGQRASAGRRLTKDHAPRWTRSGARTTRSSSSRQLDAKKRKYGPKNELFLMNPQRQGPQAPHPHQGDPLLQGLFPTDWSANGNRLLAEFEGQDTSYAVTVNPKTGAQRPLDKRNRASSGFVGTALSNDGKLVSASPAASTPARTTTSPTFPYARRQAEDRWSRTPSSPTGAAEVSLMRPYGRISDTPNRAGRPGAGSRRCRSRRPCA